MTQASVCPPRTYQESDEAFGFRVERITEVPEIRATAYQAVHLTTGARVLHLHCPDRENLYAVTFRTPPSDSTGVAHILEHSVLAGSEKYPVKDAFNELGKGSLRTFLNAFTASDFTCYPVASQARADFYNLAGVYTDLVLRPLLHPNTFRQEGHHLEVGENGELSISGIVYNEMKGAFTSPEGIAERRTIQALFPDTPYGVESGGDPAHIPDLTHEAFVAFHRRFYSPSNARFFFYGDLPTPEHLAFLGQQLVGFDAVAVNSSVPEQSRWDAPREIRVSFPIAPEDPEEARTTVNLAWLTSGVDDIEERLVLEVLEEALIGNAAAPLRKALIDSGLGQDLSPTTGLKTWYRQLPFAVGLRGTDPDKVEEFTRLTTATLELIAREGFSGDLLEAAFHQVEFKGLEISRSPFLFPLLLLFRTMSTWLHDHDPLSPLRFPTLIAGLRERWQADPDLFRRAVRRWLVDNPHRVCAVIAPSRTLSQEQDERLRESLARTRSAMSEAEMAEVRRVAEALKVAQRAKESPQALATLPRLKIEEIPRDVHTIPTRERREDRSRVLEHEIFSNGIAYVDLVFDVSQVPEELQAYLPFLGAASVEMGVAGQGYEAFATRKALNTGGVSFEVKAKPLLRSEGTWQVLALRSRALARNIPRMVEILRDIAAGGELEDSARLRDVLTEERNDLRATVAPRGHMFSWRAAAASLSLAAYRDEQWHGATQVTLLNALVERYDGSVEEITGKLRALRELVFRRDNLVINLTGDAHCLELLRGPVRDLAGALPVGPAGVSAGSSSVGGPSAAAWPRPAGDTGVVIPGKVCYVARVLPVPRHNDPASPAVLVLASYLSDGILYRKIRVEGGAYGGFSVYNSGMGQLAFLSYRDPNLEKTLEVYDSCFDAFLAEELEPDTVRKTIIGTIAGLDMPMDPATQGYIALERIMVGLTDDDRQRFRAAVLATDVEALRRGAREILLPACAQARQATFAPKARIEAANGALPRPFEIVTLE
jgi:presequence protease